ncbi:MAG: hypothetical protein RBU29_16400 [bacterium]|nr:hypothetical protein [bacterium]
MKPIHWVGIGCGGCLVIILAIVLFGVAGVFYIRTTVQNTEQISSNIRALEDQFPFTPPSDQALDPQRFETFLAARAALFQQTSPILQPIILFSDENTPQFEQSGFAVFSSVAKMLLHMPQMKELQLQIFQQNQMASPEYNYWTWLMARELSTWIDLDTAPEQRDFAQQYFSPLQVFQTNARAYEDQNPSANLDGGPFDFDTFLGKIKREDYANTTNADIVFAARDRIQTTSNTIVLDAWILEFN